MNHSSTPIRFVLILLAVLCLVVPAAAQTAVSFSGTHTEIGTFGDPIFPFIQGICEGTGENTYLGSYTLIYEWFNDLRDTNTVFIGEFTAADGSGSWVFFGSSPPEAAIGGGEGHFVAWGTIQILGGTGKFEGDTGIMTWVTWRAADLIQHWHRGVVYPGSMNGS